jgi:glutamate mutase epsilon subunit
MGMVAPHLMADGLRAVVATGARAIGTITVDSYTRVGDAAAARHALRHGLALNGYPITAHPAEVTAAVAAAAGPATPVQVRHGAPEPSAIFAAMAAAGLTASEGGPVSYCLPYGRTPLATSVAQWRTATSRLAEDCHDRGRRAHLETFGGCLMGQLCPPSLLVAISALEALFFAQHGIRSLSLSYAQQTHAAQDVAALTALRTLAEELLPSDVDVHLVLYTYMGMFPGTEHGATRLLTDSALVARHGGAERLVVKTVAEAHRIPTVAENVAALEHAAATARTATRRPVDDGELAEVLTEARALVDAVLNLSDDVGSGLLQAFKSGVLDVPYCLHADNHGRSQGTIDGTGRLRWARTGKMPLPSAAVPRRRTTAAELLTMLRHTRDRYDEPRPWRVAVVGSGPRGLAVVERMAARLAAERPAGPIEMSLVDAVEVGCGRIWRTDQPDWFLMNTVAGEVTIFSGPPDGGPARAGAGPSLAAWLPCGVNEYAPRARYGRYLRFALDAVEAGLPDAVNLRRLVGRVDRLDRHAGGYRLRFADGQVLDCDRVVLATGHPTPAPTGEQRVLADFAASRPGLVYVPGDSAADAPLARLRPGSTVGVLGLGLSFYDVTAALTTGRGGRFVADGDGLRYRPSGREPLLVAGSRGGVPLLARGDNQKPPDHRYRPQLFTAERIRRARERGPLDFDRDVLPWLLAEMDLVYYRTELRHRHGAQVADLFTEEVCAATGGPPAVARVAARFGLTDVPALDLFRLARPFADREFTGPDAFHTALRDLIRADLRAAALGNVDGPLKAALDVIRDTRGVIRAAVDFGGLTARSHRAFLDRFVPMAAALSVGPPRVRLLQTVALIDAGVLRVVGPDARFGTEAGRFTVSSPRVADSLVTLDAVVDARVPQPDIRLDPAPLTRDLRASGRWRCYVNDGGTGEPFTTGGLAVTASPFHPVDTDGRTEPGVFVLGIPTEHTRWFTQVGSARPGPWNDFVHDADAIAAAALRIGSADVGTAESRLEVTHP